MKKNKSKSTVYIAMSADIIHKGHMNIIRNARKYGDIILALTDRAIASKRVPLMSFDERKAIVSEINEPKVVSQDTLDYTSNLLKFKPSFVIHGDDWKKGVQKETRKKVIKTLKKWNGKLIEIKYTEGISSTKIIKLFNQIGTTPDVRRKHLKRLLHSKNTQDF